jgi:hypothetical protein
LYELQNTLTISFFCCVLSSEGSGNVLFDMEQQLEANQIRIELLEKENTTLRNSLVTLNERYISTMVRY